MSVCAVTRATIPISFPAACSSASPGTIAEEVEVPLPYPRQQIETRSDARYLSLRERLYRSMVAQVMAGRADDIP